MHLVYIWNDNNLCTWAMKIFNKLSLNPQLSNIFYLLFTIQLTKGKLLKSPKTNQSGFWDQANTKRWFFQFYPPINLLTWPNL